jgi:hypothetical protein
MASDIASSTRVGSPFWLFAYAPVRFRQARHHAALDIVGEAPARTGNEVSDFPIGMPLARREYGVEDAAQEARSIRDAMLLRTLVTGVM